MVTPLAFLGLPSLHSIIEGIAKGFFGALAHALVPSWLTHGTVATIQHLVALPDPAMRMRRMMTRPGSSSTGRAPILPSTTTVACCAHERRLSPNVPVTTFSSTTSAKLSAGRWW